MSTKTTGQQANCGKRPTNSPYSRPFSVESNLTMATRSACSEATRLTWEEIAKLQRKDCCFTCKEIGNYRLKYPNEWRPMSIFTNADSALARVNVNKVAVPQLDYVKVENK